MAYYEINTPGADYRVVFSQQKNHTPLVEDLPDTTDFLLTEMAYDHPSVAVDFLSNRKFWEPRKVRIKHKEVEGDPLEDIRAYARDRHIPLVAIESACSTRGVVVLREEYKKFEELKSSSLDIALMLNTASSKLIFSKSGEIKPESLEARVAAHEIDLMERFLPNTLTLRNLIMTRKSQVFIEDNPPPVDKKPHATVIAGSAHFGIRKTLRLRPEQIISQLQEYSNLISQVYDPENFSRGYGVIFLPGSTQWESFSFSDPLLAQVHSIPQ